MIICKDIQDICYSLRGFLQWLFICIVLSELHVNMREVPNTWDQGRQSARCVVLSGQSCSHLNTVITQVSCCSVSGRGALWSSDTLIIEFSETFIWILDYNIIWSSHQWGMQWYVICQHCDAMFIMLWFKMCWLLGAAECLLMLLLLLLMCWATTALSMTSSVWSWYWLWYNALGAHINLSHKTR